MKVNRPSLILSTAALLVAAVSLADAATVRSIQGPVILAKPGANAEYLWDATPYVAQLVADRLLGDDGLRAVEATAVAALVEKASASNAKSLKVSVGYKPPSASSIYGTATFAGEQPLCEVLISKVDAAKGGAQWAQSIAEGKPSPEVKITVTGKLPPAH